MVESKQSGSFQGERSTVRFVTFAPDGKTLASVGDEGIVKLWDIATGMLKQTFPGSSDSIRQAIRRPSSGPVAFSPDGRFLAISAWGEGNDPGISNYVYGSGSWTPGTAGRCGPTWAAGNGFILWHSPRTAGPL